MPELPEAERARQQIERVLGREIVAVDDTDTYVCRPHAPGEIAAALTGRRLVSAHRRGKVPWGGSARGPQGGGRPRGAGARAAPRDVGAIRVGRPADRLGPLRARVRRRLAPGAARQAPPRPRGD